jgi:hypothetical protein
MNRPTALRLPWIIAMAPLFALAATLIWLVFPKSGNTAAPVRSPALYRIAANSWNGPAYVQGIGGSVSVYDRTLSVDGADFTALYVTLTGTAHQSNGSALMLGCRIGPGLGAPCDSYGDVRVAYTANNSWPNNSFTQTWCVKPVAGATQRIQIFMSGVSLTNTNFIEHLNIHVDASNTPDACSTSGFVAQPQ